MLYSKLCSGDADLASPVATLEVSWVGWWPLFELLEIRAFCRAPIGSVVTGLVVAPGFSVKFTTMDVLFSHVIPPYPPPPPTHQSCLPFSIANPHLSIHAPNNCGSILSQNHQAKITHAQELWDCKCLLFSAGTCEVICYAARDD